MVTITRSRNAIDVEGHSGYAEKGYDIVCSAISTLVCTLAKALKEETTDKTHFLIQDGRFHMEYGNLSRAGRLLVDSFFIGVEEIAEEYPEYVRLLHR